MIRVLICLVVSNTFVISKVLQAPEKRSHSHGQGGWGYEHCWDHDPNHIMDPFCPHGLPNCTVAPTIENGYHSTEYSRSVNSTLTYMCNTGYYIIGPEVVTCVRSSTNAEWTARPTCKKGCDEAPVVSNGNHNNDYNRTIGSAAYYVCDDGYFMKGQEMVTCEEHAGTDPKWSQAPQCNKVMCPTVPEIANGYHEMVNSTMIGATVQYFCNEGFEILDNIDTITCGLKGTDTNPSWSIPNPYCIEGCHLPPFSNGFILLPGMSVTTAAPVTTQAATEPPPVTTVTEIETTTTVPDTTTEEPMTTTEEPMTTTEEPMTTTELPKTTTYEAVATTLSPDTTDTATDVFIKTKGTTVTAETPIAADETMDDVTTTTTSMPDITTTDMPDSTTEAVADTTTTQAATAAPAVTTSAPTTTTTRATTTTTSAPTTTLSPYAYIANMTTFGVNETIVFQCNPGYMVVSTANMKYEGTSVNAVCNINSTTTTKGVVSRTTYWSTTASCVPACPPIVEVYNANHTIPANTRQGVTVDYTCYPGFELVGSSQVTCMSDGTWSPLPFCRSCGPPPTIEHGSHNTDFTTVANSTVFYVCDDGFSMLGLEVVTCNTINRSPYGRWTDPPACTRSCGNVPVVENSTHTEPVNTLTGANVTYMCQDGTNMTGPRTIVCQESGFWSRTPKCNKVCVKPPPIPNSVATRYIYNETDKVRLVCEERYTLIGNDTLDCVAGHWSTPFPYCQCEIKPIDIAFIIDGSGSLGVHGFNQTLNFVSDMVSRFPIDTTHFGLVAFSTGTFPQFYLNEYVNDTDGLKERILNTTYPTGGTHTYAGLQFARTDLFTELNGMRPNVSHTAIVVTDGHSDNFNETVEQAQLLKDSGVTIYSVGVGLTDERELQLIASNETYVFTVDNYDRIDEIAGPLAGVTCASTHGVDRSSIFS